MSSLSHMYNLLCLNLVFILLVKLILNCPDDEDFEPQDFSVKQSDKWEGEDEEDQDVKVTIYLRNLQNVEFSLFIP